MNTIIWEELGFQSPEHYILQKAEDFDLLPETALDIAGLYDDNGLLMGFVETLQGLTETFCLNDWLEENE